MPYQPQIIEPNMRLLVRTLLGDYCIVYTHEELTDPFPKNLTDIIFAVHYTDRGYPMGGTVINHHSRKGCYEVDSEKRALFFRQDRLTPVYDIRKLRPHSFIYTGSIDEALKEFEEAGFDVISEPTP